MYKKLKHDNFDLFTQMVLLVLRTVNYTKPFPLNDLY